MSLRLPARLWIAFLVPIGLILAGTVGYVLIVGCSWFDALYMTVITLTTVGFAETIELGTGGRVFTMLLCFGGIFVLFYTATETIRWIVTGEFREVFGRDRMERALAELRDHVIICGLGRMGRLVAHEIEKSGIPYVVVDRDVELLKEVRNVAERGLPLHGDATSDDVLRHAGVERARALVAALPSDADNLYITLSAHILNPQLFIVARAEDEAAEAKLRKVGANQVVAPYVVGGHRAAQAVLRPSVGLFLESVMRPGKSEFDIEEVTVTPDSWLAGTSLRNSKLHEELSVVVLTIKTADGHTIYNPKADTVIEAGSVLLAVGPRENLDGLNARRVGESSKLS